MTTQSGAEATLEFSADSVKKIRSPKRYRHPELDSKLRTARTRTEARMLARAPVRVPKILSVTDYCIEMERIHGERLRDTLTPANAAHFGTLCGGIIKTLHDANIAHGDLTTSNLLVDTRGHLVLIDFGLARMTRRREDKAVDLHVLSETLHGSHPALAEPFWGAFLAAYNDEVVLRTLSAVERRGRYKAKY